MLQYILECIAFQLVFLLIYDLFLKRETFFQWNRVYLIGTYIIAMILPWVKIEALKETVPEQLKEYPEFLWAFNDTEIIVAETEKASFHLSWEYVLLYGGMLLAALFFAYKLYQIYMLRRKGEVYYFQDFTRVIIANSSMAFSFFKSIFLGDKVVKKEHQNILEHELVHIKQKHSYDLLFFELMRIVGWFNPLVYVYQRKVSELHEFIADAQVAKTCKKEQYEFLLSQIFQTQNISFINQFFKSSLIKKRIVMLQKTKSKRILKWKYVLLLPVMVGMLFYTSCQTEEKASGSDSKTIAVSSIHELSLGEETEISNTLKVLSENNSEWELFVIDNENELKFLNTSDGNYISGFNGERINAKMEIISNTNVKLEDIFGKNKMLNGIPFSTVEEVPIFPGCEDSEDKRACFNTMMQKHIMKNFNYPAAAQENAVQGKVYAMFTIGADGNIRNVKMRGPDKLLEKEVARIISTLPQMQAGRADGKAVNVPFSIPVNFKLQADNIDEGSTLKSDTMRMPFAKIDEAPIFLGCEDADDKRACFNKMMQKHIVKHFKYPLEAQEKGIQGKVSTMFTISKDGSIKNVRMRGPDKLLEEEVARMISKLPKIQPGKHDGELMDVPYSIPVNFKLQ